MPVFVSFAGEDSRYRDYVVEHSDQPSCPYEVIDHSVHGTFDDEWKRHVRTKIRRSALTLMLIGLETHRAAGALWEVETSLVEGIPAFGIRIFPGQWVTYPRCFRAEHVIRWSWDGIAQMFSQAARYHASRTLEWSA